MSVRVVGETTRNNDGQTCYKTFYFDDALYQVNENVIFEGDDKTLLLGSIHYAVVDKNKIISCSFKMYSRQDDCSKELILATDLKTFPFKNIKIHEKVWVLRKQVYDLHQERYGERAVYYCDQERTGSGTTTTIAKQTIHQAVLANDFAATSLLIYNGQDINVPHSTTTSTPLHYACQYGYSDIIKLLLDNGAVCNATNKEGFTPLHFASCEGYQASKSVLPVKLLLSHGVSRDTRDFLKKKTASEWAQHYELTKVVHYINNWPEGSIEEDKGEQKEGKTEEKLEGGEGRIKRKSMRRTARDKRLEQGDVQQEKSRIDRSTSRDERDTDNKKRRTPKRVKRDSASEVISNIPGRGQANKENKKNEEVLEEHEVNKESERVMVSCTPQEEKLKGNEKRGILGDGEATKTTNSTTETLELKETEESRAGKDSKKAKGGTKEAGNDKKVHLEDVIDLPDDIKSVDIPDVSSNVEAIDMEDVEQTTSSQSADPSLTQSPPLTHELMSDLGALSPSPEHPQKIEAPPMLPECYVFIEDIDHLIQAYNDRKRSSELSRVAEGSDWDVSEKLQKRHVIVIDDDEEIDQKERAKEHKKGMERGDDVIKNRMGSPPTRRSVFDTLDDPGTPIKETGKNPSNPISPPKPPHQHETTDKELELLLKYERRGLINRMDAASSEFIALAEELRSTERMGKRLELDAVWKVHQEKVNAVFDACAVKNIKIGYHTSTLDTLLDIVSDGFRLPPDTSNEAGNGVLFLGRMIYFASQAMNSLDFSDECEYSLQVDMKVGHVKQAERRKMTTEPSALIRNGYDSINSKTVSKRGEIWAIPHPSQVVPRYLLKFSKVSQDTLSSVVSRSHKLPRVSYDIQVPGQLGLVDENKEFICIWDKQPAWTIHCLVLPKANVTIDKFELEDFEVLDAMESFVQAIIKRYHHMNSAWKFECGFSMLSAEKLLHCHVYTSNSQIHAQSRNDHVHRKFTSLLSFADLRKFITIAIARTSSSRQSPSHHNNSPSRNFERQENRHTLRSPRPSYRNSYHRRPFSPRRSSSSRRTYSPPPRGDSPSPRRRYSSRSKSPRRSSRPTSHTSANYSAPSIQQSSPGHRSTSPYPRPASSPLPLPLPPSPPLPLPSSSPQHLITSSHLHPSPAPLPPLPPSVLPPPPSPNLNLPSPLSLPVSDSSEPMVIDVESAIMHEMKRLQKIIQQQYGVTYPIEAIHQSAFQVIKRNNASKHQPNTLTSASFLGQQSGPNSNDGPNTNGGPNAYPKATGGPNANGGSNANGDSNAYGGPNACGGPNAYGGPNMQHERKAIVENASGLGEDGMSMCSSLYGWTGGSGRGGEGGRGGVQAAYGGVQGGGSTNTCSNQMEFGGGQQMIHGGGGGQGMGYSGYGGEQWLGYGGQTTGYEGGGHVAMYGGELQTGYGGGQGIDDGGGQTGYRGGGQMGCEGGQSVIGDGGQTGYGGLGLGQTRYGGYGGDQEGGYQQKTNNGGGQWRFQGQGVGDGAGRGGGKGRRGGRGRGRGRGRGGPWGYRGW